MMDYVINTLNIENREKRIIYIYDSSCESVDDNTKNTNICSFKNSITIKLDYFSNRESVLKDLYASTLTYSTLRALYRLIINYIKKVIKKRYNYM